MSTAADAILSRVGDAMRERLDRDFGAAFGLPGGGKTNACTAKLAATGTALTIEKMRAAMRALDRIPPAPVDLLNRIIVTSAATKDGERLFPASRHRSRRLRKKLIKRHGGEFAKLPTMYKVGDTMLVHPALARDVIAKFEVKAPDAPLYPNFGGVSVIWSGR